MKRENLQRANELEKQIKEREAKLQSIGYGVYVAISVIPGGSPIMQLLANEELETPYNKDACQFVTIVKTRLQSEVDSLLKEMEEL